MNAFTQLVPPRTGTVDFTGRCLPFAQSFFGAPIRHDYARQAWDAAQPDGGKSLVQADGIHPVIGAGTNLQRDTIKAWVEDQSRRPA